MPCTSSSSTTSTARLIRSPTRSTLLRISFSTTTVSPLQSGTVTSGAGPGGRRGHIRRCSRRCAAIRLVMRKKWRMVVIEMERRRGPLPRLVCGGRCSPSRRRTSCPDLVGVGQKMILVRSGGGRR